VVLVLAGSVLLVAGASVREMLLLSSSSSSGRVAGTGGEDGGDSNSSSDFDLDLDLDLDSGSLVGVSDTCSRPSSRLESMCFRFLLEVRWPESACFRFLVLCDGVCS
jgi:hypothetical protein